MAILAVDLVPAGQSVQTVNPFPDWYFPDAQRLQRIAPVPVENIPGTHAGQADTNPLFEAVPGWQDRQADAPASEYTPCRQAWHTPDWVAPVMLEYHPAKHWTQLALVGSPDALEYVPVGQAVHTAGEPSRVEYVPAEQRMHTGA